MPTVTTRDESRPALADRVLVSPRTAFLITDILSDPEARAYAFGYGSYLDFPFPVAVKTGTSQAYHDNWMVGYTHDVTVGVWVGNFDRTRLQNSSGVTGAGPIFHAVMLAATAGRASASAAGILRPPDGLEQTTICALSGLRANPWCPSRAREWTVRGADAAPCDWHHQSDEGLVTILPPEYRAWALASGTEPARRTAGSFSAADGGPITARTGSDGRGARGRGGSIGSRGGPDAAPALVIANPPAGAIYSVDPTLRHEFQALPLRAVSRRPTTITWLVDGSTVGRTSSDRPLPWPLTVGTHDIEARDTDGRQARTSVVVR